jgi:DNA polymerase-3 subunit gamma/tau
MSYTVLARKYRPQTFADMVGQEHVSRTLANALQSGRVAHAFLFTGARGVGKTTTARLLAKALNCEQGPTATPCNVCDPCREITAGNDIDVLEIDGASNNGVDDVRRLQETLPFRPARDRFKIVIVDEVHMLSVGAFNAFLKTLEEPPAHVKFVFATTEIHKVPITIRSRCQRYDFRLIPHAVVAERVRSILASEQINADDAAVALVAREAAGSMRDALTVLDQVLALGDTDLHGDTVARGLAIASRESVLHTTEALLSGDAAACLQLVAAIAEQGLDLLHFTRQLLECARDLVVLRVVGGADPTVALPPDELTRAKQLAEAHDRAELERLFGGLTKLIEDVGQAAMPQMTLEMGLVRLASRPPLVSVQELITRLKGFEDLLSGGPNPSGPGPGGSAGAGFGSGSSGPRPSGPPRRPSGPSGSSAPSGMSQAEVRGSASSSAAPQLRDASAPAGHTPQPSEAPRPPTRLVAVPAPPPPPPPAAASSSPRIPDNAISNDKTLPPMAAAHNLSAGAAAALRLSQSLSRNQATTSSRPAAKGAPQGFTPPPSRDVQDEQRAPHPAEAYDSEHTQVAPPPAAGAGSHAAAPPAPAAPPSAASAVDSATATDWSRIVGIIRSAQPALGAVLDHGMPLEVTAKTLRIGFPDGSFFGRQAQSGTAKEAVLRAAAQVLGARPELVIGSPGDVKISTLAQIEEDGKRQRSAAKREAALRHPAVVDAMEIFEESEASVDVQVDLE